jgi:hypothetical protein
MGDSDRVSSMARKLSLSEPNMAVRALAECERKFEPRTKFTTMEILDASLELEWALPLSRQSTLWRQLKRLVEIGWVKSYKHKKTRKLYYEFIGAAEEMGSRASDFA